MTEASPRPEAEQARATWGIADAVSALRLPLGVLFIAWPSTTARLVILAAAGATDLLDGLLARWLGPSRVGAVVDPVADRLFMACAFLVVAMSGKLTGLEVIGVLLRDIGASIAFFITGVLGRPAAIPARAGGKALTLLQILTLLAFLLAPQYLRPMAWACIAVGLYAMWDYYQARDSRRDFG